VNIMTTNTTKTQHPCHQALEWIADGEAIQGLTKEGTWIDLTQAEALCTSADNELRLKPVPHVHQELITARENGARIQHYATEYNEWLDCIWNDPVWDTNRKYRIKPTPKPDVVGYCNVDLFPHSVNDLVNISFGQCSDKLLPTDNLKLVFCGETLKLKSVEMLQDNGPADGDAFKGTDNDTI